MPTAKPRLSLALTPQQYELLSRLARLQECSRASIVVDLLEQVTPVMERLVVVGEAAERARIQARHGLRESMERAEAEILPHVQTALGQLDIFLSDIHSRIETAKEGGGAAAGEHSERAAAPPSGRQRTPVPVTTGVRSKTHKRRKRAKSLTRKGKA